MCIGGWMQIGVCAAAVRISIYIGEQLSSITSTYFANLQVPVQCVISLRFAIGVSGYSAGYSVS